MDEYPTKKAANRTGLPRRQTGLSVRDGNHEAGSSQCCNRLSCSTRVNCTNRKQTPGKPKTVSSTSHASSSKVVAGSSRLVSSPTSLRKTPRRPQTPREVNLVSNRNRQESLKQPNSTLTSLEDHIVKSERETLEDTEALQNSSSLQNMVPGGQNFPAMHGPKLQKRLFQRSDLGSHSHSSDKKVTSRNSAPSRPVGEPSVAISCSLRASSSRNSNIGCSSTSDVLLSRFSMLHPEEPNRLRESNANERPDRDNLTPRRKRVASSSSTAMTNSRMSIRRHNMSFTSSPLSLQPRRSSGGCSTIRERIRSAGSRQGPGGIGNMRSEDSTNNISISRRPQLSNGTSSSISSVSSSSSSSMNVPHFYPNSYETSESDEMAQDRPSTHLESSSGGSHGPSLDEEEYQRFNLDGIAEILFALERIEQDEELTYEQLLVLETNLFLGGLAFHDRHRDLRMDIDHMTYEELLALEEKIGSVSTAVSEEALSKCYRKSLYSSLPAASGIRTRGDDVKCSICQEEFADGDEVAHLLCDHRYHLKCIHVWLRLKNWCPICKAPAVPE